MTIHDEYPELAEFLGAYFNQDFYLEYAGSEAAAVDDFVSDLGTTTWVEDVLEELIRLLACPRSDRQLDDYVINGAMSIRPERGARTFLLEVQERLERAIADSATAPSAPVHGEPTTQGASRLPKPTQS